MKREDILLRICMIVYLAILGTCIATKSFVLLVIGVFVPCALVFVYGWYVHTYLPKKRLLDEAVNHKPYERPSVVCPMCEKTDCNCKPSPGQVKEL